MQSNNFLKNNKPSSYELAEKLGRLIKEERKITNEILEVLNQALKTRCYLELGFSSLFDWLTKGFGYSNASAFRRIEAAKLLQSNPEVSKKLEMGEVNLSTLCKVQSVIKAQEKISGEKVSSKEKEKVIKRIEKKSVEEAEKTLFSIFPDTASTIHQERRVVINESTTRHMMNLSKEATDHLNRAKEVLSHKFPNASDSEIISYALEFLLKKIDPLMKDASKKSTFEKPTSKAEAKCVIDSNAGNNWKEKNQKEWDGNLKSLSKAAIKRRVIQKSNASCTYKDPGTGQVCGSRHQIQIDHIHPKMLGGTDRPENLRTLCRQHNLLAAEQVLGDKLMTKYRNRF